MIYVISLQNKTIHTSNNRCACNIFTVNRVHIIMVLSSRVEFYDSYHKRVHRVKFRNKQRNNNNNIYYAVAIYVYESPESNILLLLLSLLLYERLIFGFFSLHRKQIRL